MLNQGAVQRLAWLKAMAGRLAVACVLLALAGLAWGQSDGSEASLQGFQTPAAKDAPTGPNRMLTLHSDLRFSLLSASRKAADADTAQYQAQVSRVAARLQAAVKKAYPDALGRTGTFDVFVADTQKLYAMSSGSGKIALSAGFAPLKPTDEWVAFVVAREMGHVIAGHHDSNAGASIAVSVAMNFIVPGSGVIKSVLSLGGSELASGRNRERQGKEADEVAMKLLATAGYSNKSVLRSLQQRPISEEASGTGWAGDYRESLARLTTQMPKVPESPARRGKRPAPVDQGQLVNWKPGDAKPGPARRPGTLVAKAGPVPPTAPSANPANRFSLDACSGCWSTP